MTTKNTEEPGGALTLPDQQAGTAVEVYAEFDDVDDGLDSVVEQFGIATPRIVTNMKFGHPAFVDELTGEAPEELRVTILGSTVGRAWWETDKIEKGRAPDCRSIDSVTPDPMSPKLQSDRCAACDHSQWGENNERPSCRQSALVLVYDHDAEGPRILRVAGTSIRIFDRYVSLFRSSPKRNNRWGKAFQWITTISTEIVDDDYDKHQEMRFAASERLEPDAIRELLVLRDAIGWRDRLADDLARADEPADGAAAPGEAIEFGPDEEPF